MDDKVVGAFKVAKGVVTGGSAVLTSLGMGLLGGYLRSHHMMGTAARIGQKEMEHAQKDIKEGVERWKRA